MAPDAIRDPFFVAFGEACAFHARLWLAASPKAPAGAGADRVIARNL